MTHPPNHQRCRSSCRAGFTVLEMFVATVVFGTVLLTFVPLLHSVRQQQRATEQHLLALREAENVLELLSQRPWAELTVAELAKLELADDVQTRLPQSALQIDVDEPAEQPPSKRLAVRVSWTPRIGRPGQSVRLVAWVAQREDQP